MFNLNVLAQTTVNTSFDTGALIVPGIISLAFAILMIAAWWRVFTKAGRPGWAALIPIYNIIVLLQIAGKPGWWFLLMLVPFVNFVILIILMLDLAKVFGYGVGFAIGLMLLFPIFILILGLGDSKYVGPTRADGAQLKFA